MRFLITAGPTREYLDPVRFLSNGSTGKMGYACARAALQRGHEVTLVTGPVALAAPKGLELIKVISSQEMARSVNRCFDKCHCVIMTAAVCDYRPQKTQAHKISKNSEILTLELKKTEDILAGLGRTKTAQILIGFAVQDKAARQNARRKHTSKNLDAIVLNSPAAFGADRSSVEILQKDGKWQSLGQISKTALAARLVKLAEQLRADQT